MAEGVCNKGISKTDVNFECYTVPYCVSPLSYQFRVVELHFDWPPFDYIHASAVIIDKTCYSCCSELWYLINNPSTRCHNSTH